MFQSMNRILRWTKGYHRRLYLGSLCSFLATWAAAGPVMLAAWALGLVIESAQEGTALDAKLPWLCLGGIILLILLRFVCAYWKNRLQESIGTERAAQQRLELGDLLKRVSLGYFSKNNLGDILAALTTELSTLELQSMKMVDAVINGYLQVLVIVLCMAFFCPEAALVAVVGVLLSAFALRGIGRQSARTAPVGHRAQEALSGAAIEYIHGLSVVKSFGQEGVSSQRFFEACRANKDIRIKNEFGFVPWNCLHLFSLKAAAVGLVLTAGWQALAGALPLQYFLMIALFSFTIFGSVEAINDAAHILSVTDSVLDRLEELAAHLKSNSLCALGQTAPNPVLSTLRYFKDEYIAHIVDKKCPAGVCKDLLQYKINADKCKGCTLCARICPNGAISGKVKEPHAINPEKCLKCGACMEKCRFGAIYKE